MLRGWLDSVLSQRSKLRVGILVPMSSWAPRSFGSVSSLSAAMQSRKRVATSSFIADNHTMRVIFLIGVISSFAAAAEIRVGSAAVVITPPIGTPLAGYYNTRISDAVHDDLYAKALVLECGGTRSAMVCC